jgi:general secretion pathway protein E
MDSATVMERLIGSRALAPQVARAMTEPDEGSDAGALSYRKLLEASGLRSGDFADLVADAHRLPRIDLNGLRGGASLVDRFSWTFLNDAGLYPFRSPEGRFKLALADPTLHDAIDAIAMTIGEDIALEIASFDDIEIALADGKRSEDTSDPQPSTDQSDREDIDNLRDLASGAPVVRALEDIFERAVAMRATDIHIEPLPRDFQVRVRIDGIMRMLPPIRGIPQRALISRIKILSGINIAEHRVPQDGRSRIRVRDREFDIRVATMPTTGGEAAVLRLLERGNRLIELEQFGFSPRDDEVLRRQLAMPHGLFVVTGPTGSGKTTTLAAAISSLNDSTRKILTIEDPVEYALPGVAQSQVRQAVGLTFASALRAFLRQDPDVVMVGEVRDPETAKIAVQAALTGHLVMTTLHTNTAAAAVTRLVDIGIEPYLLASTLTTVIGQRLVRVLCTDCKRRTTITADLRDSEPRLAALGIEVDTVLYEPVGCERCNNTGYRGRRAIFEVLEVTDTVRRQMLKGADDAAIEIAARADGMTTMVEDGRMRCLAGVTSLDEVFRVATFRDGATS